MAGFTIGALEPIEQSYERLTTGTYRYLSAGGLFDRRLTVRGDGFVVDYPGQWRAEAAIAPADPAPGRKDPEDDDR